MRICKNNALGARASILDPHFTDAAGPRQVQFEHLLKEPNNNQTGVFTLKCPNYAWGKLSPFYLEISGKCH